VPPEAAAGGSCGPRKVCTPQEAAAGQRCGRPPRTGTAGGRRVVPQERVREIEERDEGGKVESQRREMVRFFEKRDVSIGTLRARFLIGARSACRSSVQFFMDG